MLTTTNEHQAGHGFSTCADHPNPDLTFEIRGCLLNSIGVVVLQPCAFDFAFTFAGRQLNSAERRYHSIYQEFLAVMFALQQWRCYLQGAKRKFVLFTAHHPTMCLFVHTALSEQEKGTMVREAAGITLLMAIRIRYCLLLDKTEGMILGRS